jgi:hypothetical protein
MGMRWQFVAIACCGPTSSRYRQYAPGAQVQPQLPSARQQGSTPTGKQLCLQLQDSLARLLALPAVALRVLVLLLDALPVGAPAAPLLGALVLCALRPALLAGMGLDALPPTAAAEKLPAAPARGGCARPAAPVVATGALLQLVQAENAPLVGELASGVQARTPWPPSAHVHGARSPGVHASPVKMGGAGAAGSPITCSGSAP